MKFGDPFDLGAVWEAAAPIRRTDWDPRRRNFTAELLDYIAGANPKRRREWYELVARTHQAAAARRDYVQAHPDLSGRLANVLRLGSLDQWTGHIPEDGDLRRAVIAVLRAVAARQVTP
jgi:hypothetical protein